MNTRAVQNARTIQGPRVVLRDERLGGAAELVGEPLARLARVGCAVVVTLGAIVVGIGVVVPHGVHVAPLHYPHAHHVAAVHVHDVLVVVVGTNRGGVGGGVVGRQHTVVVVAAPPKAVVGHQVHAVVSTHTDLLDLTGQLRMREQLEGVHHLRVAIGMARWESHAIVLVVTHGVAVVVLGDHEDAAVVGVDRIDQGVCEIQFVQLG